ncbi:hypothetical protein HPB52_017391 [Rhipicephalus sanguineus]|uniref:Uncharacterized protein n=1 Tax=Rhipicephalus sanguineus TaxID=34632 RepID=A0A9D4T5U7_RHISA|nr:hypothetical protein HPB52_017391 [Rhipicephalus sanguineus]
MSTKTSMDRTPKKSGDHAFDRRMSVGLNHDAVGASGAACHLPSLQPISSGEQAPAPSPNKVTKVTRQRRCGYVLPRATHYRMPVSENQRLHKGGHCVHHFRYGYINIGACSI